MILALLACTGEDTGAEPIDTSVEDTGEVLDPLSMPKEPTLSVSQFNPASMCQECHPDHYAQWAGSNHAYAMVDPLFQALTTVRQATYDGKQDRFCLQCHTAIGTRGGEIVPGFSYADLSPIVMEGITCESCHKVTAVDRLYNSGHVLAPDGAQQGPITDPALSTFHASVGNPLHGSSEFCGACHDLVEVSGVSLERPYEEWLESPARIEGTNCQGCHMPASEGQAAVDGPDRTVHDHSFVSIDVPLLTDFWSEEEEVQRSARTTEFLTGIAAMDVVCSSSQGELDVVLTVDNLLEGHALPTGSTFIRELWVELIVTDATGATVFETGTLDENGDLRGYWSELDPYGDTELVTFASGLVDVHGDPTLFPWVATEHWSAAIPPGYSRTATWFVDTSTAVAPLTVEARLRLRPIPPHLLRLVGLDAGIPRVPTYDLAEASAVVDTL